MSDLTKCHYVDYMEHKTRCSKTDENNMHEAVDKQII